MGQSLEGQVVFNKRTARRVAFWEIEDCTLEKVRSGEQI